MPPLYLFNFPHAIGGAGTKVAHLLRLLHADYDITLVPNDPSPLADAERMAFVRSLNVKAALLPDLPPRLDGWAVSLCNSLFFTDGLASEAKRRGLRVAWGSEMMWAHPGENAAVWGGLVDTVLYTGEAQRDALRAGYTCDGLFPAPRGAVVGNYIDPACYPFLERPARAVLTAGRVSRADPAKFPDDFPLTMHFPGVPHLHVRVLGWGDELTERYAGYDFTPRSAGMASSLPVLVASGAAANTGRLRHARATGEVTWDLLPPGAEDVCAFLHSLDFYVYDTGPGLRESWGRAVVEAMLTGLPVLIPADRRHHLHELVPHGVAGFHCATREDWERAALALTDAATRARMGRAAADHARRVLFNEGEHREAWRKALRR